MTVYIILYAFALAAVMINTAKKDISADRKASPVICIAFGLALTVISGIRLSVGHDYNLYAGVFYDLNFMDMDEISAMRREKGFMLILRLINTVTEKYTVCFAVLSALIYPLVMHFILRHSDNGSVSILSFLSLGLFFNSLNFIPQFIAAVICAYAFDYAIKGCPWRFLVLTLFACSFHRSAVIIIPCFLFVCIGWNRITLILSLAASAFLFLFSEDILSLVTEYVYTYYDIGSNPEMTNGLPPYYTIMFGAVFILGFILKDRLKGDKKETDMLLWCSFAAFFFELIGIRFAIVSRFAVLFMIPAALVLVPKIFTAICSFAHEKKGRNMKLAAAAMMCIVMFANFGVLLSKNYNGVVPYRTVFSAEEAYK